MNKQSYYYLGEESIAIGAPFGLLTRINRNFEETPSENIFSKGTITLWEKGPVEFSRDRSKSYLMTKKNNSRSYSGIDFLRYGVRIRTIWKKDPLNYEVENFLPLDETGALTCFKKIYYSTPPSKEKALIHGSLVQVGKKGILIIGKCWSGKTSLTLGFLSKLKGKLIADGNVLISYKNSHITGHYLPRPVFVRFHSISSHEGLSRLLENPLEAEAIQPFDKEAIEEIISKKLYNLDAGLNISRKKFAELMNIETIPSQNVDIIIHTNYCAEGISRVTSQNTENTYKELLGREFPKITSIGNLRHQREIKPPNESIIKKNWIENVERLRILFDAKRNLSKDFLEDLICSH